MQAFCFLSLKPDEDLPEVLSNPCDGSCKDNPSGLFAHRRRTDWFIQCGSGLDYNGQACTCCQPHYIRCPRGTSFDARTYVCSKLSDTVYHV